MFSTFESGGKALLNKLSPRLPPQQQLDNEPAPAENKLRTSNTNINKNKPADSDSSSDEDQGGTRPGNNAGNYGYSNFRAGNRWAKKSSPELFGDARQQTWFRKQLLADSDDDSDEQVCVCVCREREREYVCVCVCVCVCLCECLRGLGNSSWQIG